MAKTKNENGLDQVRCKLHATCQRHCDSQKPHDAASCNCVCEFNDHARCVPFGPQEIMLSEAEESMQVPGQAAAR